MSGGAGLGILGQVSTHALGLFSLAYLAYKLLANLQPRPNQAKQMLH